jgi:putative NIF3 family GTP cyclohydrolase 1 type 2
MRARELHAYLRSNAPWVDGKTTVDTFKAGDPKTEVRGIAVSWMARTAALKSAHEQGLNVFITHEPTFWAHQEEPLAATETDRAEKEAWLAETGMVVIRCHDMLDQMPGFGIQDSWAAWLGWHGRPYEQMDAFRRIYDLEPRPLEELARQVAEKTAPLGQSWVEYLGDPDRVVSQAGIGTGAIVGPMPMLAAFRYRGADVVLLTETTRWRDLAWAEDVGLPLLLIDHAVAEAPAMRALAEHLAEQFPDVPVKYVPSECPTRLAGVGPRR